MPRKPSTPSYRQHKPSGQAVVTLSGRDYYLGPYDSDASRAEYDRLVAEWLANGRYLRPPEKVPDLTVAEVLESYWAHAKLHYRRPDPVSGALKTSNNLQRVKQALRPVRALYGHTPAAKFGPLALRACRQTFVDAGYARRHCNQLTGCIKRAWAWAVAEELLPPAAHQALTAVEGLRQGHSQAREGGRILPAPLAAVRAVQREVAPQIAALIDLQLYTAARPGELLGLRPGDLDRSEAVWLYRPQSHKTAHRGHERVILIGPRGQKALAPFLFLSACFDAEVLALLLQRAPAEILEDRLEEVGVAWRSADAYCFSPREVATWWEVQLHQESNLQIECGPRYRTDAYGRTVRRGWEKAEARARKEAEANGDEVPEGKTLIERWHPHQLRHTAATCLVEEFGWDVARIILGHRHVNVTRLYAEDELKKAVEAIKKVG